MDLNKTFLFPGWMSRVKNYQLGEGAEIWQQYIDPGTNFDAEYLLGHSLGANFALLNWRANKHSKLILVNPILFNHFILVWFFHWLRYVFSEGLIVTPKDIKSNRIFFGFRIGYSLLQPDYVKIIREIPKENLIIIRGKRDNYLCNQKVADFIRSENIRLIGIEDSGHNWNDEFKQTAQTVLTEWQKH